MIHPPPNSSEESHAFDLELQLCTAHSFLRHHMPNIRDGRSLRILDLALLNAIADLEVLCSSPIRECFNRQAHPIGP